MRGLGLGFRGSVLNALTFQMPIFHPGVEGTVRYSRLDLEREIQDREMHIEELSV